MAFRTLERIFNPQRIALIGVTINPNSVGGKVLSNLVGGGFRGVVYPVNPDSEAVSGIQCYPDLIGNTGFHQRHRMWPNHLKSVASSSRTGRIPRLS